MSGVYIRGRVAPGWPYLVPDCVFAVRLSIVYRIVAYLAGSGFSTGVVGFVAIRDPDRPESSIRFLKDLRSARYDGELRGNLIRYLTACGCLEFGACLSAGRRSDSRSGGSSRTSSSPGSSRVAGMPIRTARSACRWSDGWPGGSSRASSHPGSTSGGTGRPAWTAWLAGAGRLKTGRADGQAGPGSGGLARDAEGHLTDPTGVNIVFNGF